MITAWQVVANRFGRTIGEEHTGVVAKHGIPNCRFHAHARRTSRDDQVPDPHVLEPGIQVCLIEAAKAMLVEDRVARAGG